MKEVEDYEVEPSNILYNKRGVMNMRLTIELSDVSKSDKALFEKMSSPTLSITVKTCENYMQVNAFGSYDDLIPVIMQATAFKSYTIKLH